MNRNVESHFAELPSVDISRSIFDLSTEHKTSFNAGLLIPHYWNEVLPGDTWQMTTSAVVRLQTLLNPIMDNVYMDTYYFFVPARLTWTHWKQFMGESDKAWLPTTEYSVPYVTMPDGGFDVGTIADYMGIPVGVDGTNLALEDLPIALPFRAYALICDQWFRDQNLSDPLNIPTGDSSQNGSNGDNYILDVVNGGKPFKVAKYHDYFTSSLPAPLKASSPIDAFDIRNLYPVGTTPDLHAPIYQNNGTNAAGLLTQGASDPTQFYPTSDIASVFRLNSSNDYVAGSSGAAHFPVNLWADLRDASALTVSELRMAFQLQKYYEKNARAGTRYREVLLEHFGVRSADARMMIPEYLGGHRFPLSIHQVANTSQTDDAFLGDLGAMSNTSDVHQDFVQSFTEHGFIIGVTCVRYDHSYPQGLNRRWSRRSKLDYYWPVFANLSERGTKLREIYLDPNAGDMDPDHAKLNSDVFGYQEQWAEYRFDPNRVSGEMRPGIQNSLASWHLADYYTAQPSLSDSWIREDPANIDRVLAVTSQVSHQIFADFYFDCKVTRPMPVYSIPGLVDHH